MRAVPSPVLSTSRVATAAALLLTLLCSMGAQAQDAPAVRLGYVDIQHALSQVDDGRRAMEQLESELTTRQSALEQREARLREMSEQLDQELVMLDADTRRQRLAEYQQLVEEFQEFYLTNQQELVEMEAAATRDIVARMVGIVQEIAQEQNLTMVFEKTRSALVWGQPDLDLTDELIRRYEASQ